MGQNVAKFLIFLSFLGCGAQKEGLRNLYSGNRLLALDPLLGPVGSGSLVAKTLQKMSFAKLSNQLDIRISEKDEDRRAVTGKIFYNNIPLCEYGITSSPYEDDVLVLGTIPKRSPTEYSSPPLFPDFKESLLVTYEKALFEDLLEPYKLISQSKCYILRAGELKPVTVTHFSASEMPYVSLADETEVYLLEEQFFEIDGRATIFSENPTNREFDDFTLKDLDDSGYLSSPTHYTELPSEVSSKRARTTDGLFNFSDDIDSFEFIETSVYTNLERAINWFKSIGFKGGKRVKVIPGKVFSPKGGGANNAVFIPGPLNSDNRIELGLGDGKFLQNLTLDYDVLNHEYAHLVSYQWVDGFAKSLDTAMIHEGLSDFFTFARSNDSCLAESVCPLNTNSCQKRGCLRSGDNDYKYSFLADIGPNNPHVKSQIVSGFLWDLIEAGHDPIDVAKFVLNTLKIMPSTAGLSDLITALIATDKSEYDEKYDADLQKTFKRRDLLKLAVSPAIAKKEDPKNLLNSCGMLSEINTKNGELILFFLLMLPIVAVLFMNKSK